MIHLRSARRLTAVSLAVAAASLGGATGAAAQEPDHHQEYTCTPGILGTGLLCSSAPVGEEPAPDLWQGGPLGSDSATAEALRNVLGGGLLG